jgi:hypothetical protein
MKRDRLMRATLHVTAVANLGAALLFAFPESLGSLAGLPSPVPAVYGATLAALVALFGATYAWLARQPVIDRPLVVFSAAGKTAFVAVVLFCWLAGQVPFVLLLTASGDLVFAGIFVWWLTGQS